MILVGSFQLRIFYDSSHSRMGHMTFVPIDSLYFNNIQVMLGHDRHPGLPEKQLYASRIQTGLAAAVRVHLLPLLPASIKDSAHFCVRSKGTSILLEGQALTPQHNLHLLQKGIIPLWEMVHVLCKARRSHKNGDSCKSSKSVHKPTGSQSHVSARVQEQDSSPSPRPALTVSTAVAEHKQQLPAQKAGFAFRHAQTEQLEPSTDQ